LDHFVQQYSKAYQIPIKGFSTSALNKLLSYSYPGNIRELINIVQKSIVLATGEVINDIGLNDNNYEPVMPVHSQLPEAVEVLEKRMIMEALKQYDHIQTRAAENLGISERTLRYKLEKYGLKADQ